MSSSSEVCPGEELRHSLLQASPTRPLRAVGAANALAAHIAAEAGAECLWLSSLEVSTSHGLPDRNLVGPREMIDLSLAIRRVADLPLIVDIDNASGSVEGAVRYARDMMAVGAAGICLEDSRYPKTNSFSTTDQQGLADINFVCRQLAAIRRAIGPRLTVIGRTEALVAGATEAEGLRRAKAMHDAGADVALVHSRDPTGAQASRVAHAWRAYSTPIATISTAFERMTVTELGQAGFQLIIYANQLTRVAISAMTEGMRRFVDTGSFSAVSLCSVSELVEINGRALRNA